MPKGIPRDKSLQRTIIHRLKIAEGHLKKVTKMTENGEYCMDVINQSLAVQMALKKVDELILKNHLQTCVRDSVKKGGTEESIEEIIGVIERW